MIDFQLHIKLNYDRSRGWTHDLNHSSADYTIAMSPPWKNGFIKKLQRKKK